MNPKTIIMIIQIISLIVLFVDLLFVLRQNPSPMQNYLICMLIATMIMFVGYIMEMGSRTIEEVELSAAMAYMGKPFIMLYSFMFICSFYNFKINRHLFFILNLLCAGIFVLVYNNPTHHLYYGTTTYNASLPFSPLVITHGKLYFVYILTAIAFFTACVIAIIKGYLKNKTKQNLRIAMFMSLMVVCGLGGYAAFLIDAIKGYDTTLLGILGSTLCLSIMFFKYRIFDVLTYAKNEALQDSSVGLVVLNQADTIMYSNNVGDLLIDKIGLDSIKDINEKGSNAFVDDKVYFVTSKQIHMNGIYYGKAIEFSDITISYNYQKQLQHDVEVRTEKIENIQREIIGSLASIVEARSLETGEHIARTREYVELTAKGLREKGLYKELLTDQYISTLANAAPLHDIGKISIPDNVLNKPGKLTKEEFELMKTHSKLGAEVIEKTMRGVEEDEYVELAIEVASCHHEWFDGSGYPNGLKGKDIPLSARIMALADTYDALISKRCYKPAYSKLEAIKIIKEETGKHFDPDVVEAFISKI